MSTATEEKIKELKKELGRDLETPFKVLKTMAYNIFERLDGNRTMNPHHLVRLKNSFNAKALLSPIIVNEKYEIIDGQHRFETLRSLGLPIYYIVVPGYGLEEVHILNSNSSVWKKTDYLQGYCDLGLKPYLEFRKFMQDFPAFGVQASLRILTGFKGENGKSVRNEDRTKTIIKIFENGNLKIDNLGGSYDNARKIAQFKPYYEGWNKRSFVAAMLHIFKNEKYKQKEMIAKIEQQAGKLRDCTCTTAYIELLENIYNYKRVQKVNLRY